MPSAPEVSIDQLDAFFRHLPAVYQKKFMRQAMRAGGSTLIKRIRGNITTMVGARSASRDRSRRRTVTTKIKSGARKGNVRVTQVSLASTITQRIRKGRNGNIYAVVGASYPHGAHAHLVERGHRIVTHDGKDTGKRARPIPFQRKAEQEAGFGVLRAMSKKMKTRVKTLRADQPAIFGSG